MREHFLTKEGLKKLKEEYQKLQTKGLAKIREKLQRIREEEPNLQEIPQFQTILAEKERVMDRISELSRILRNYKVIEKKEGDVVALGSSVVVEVEGEVDEFTIVGSQEADPAQGKISNESPAGKALLGAGIGDKVKVTTSKVKVFYKVLKIK